MAVPSAGVSWTLSFRRALAPYFCQPLTPPPNVLATPWLFPLLLFFSLFKKSKASSGRFSSSTHQASEIVEKLVSFPYLQVGRLPSNQLIFQHRLRVLALARLDSARWRATSLCMLLPHLSLNPSGWMFSPCLSYLRPL